VAGSLKVWADEDRKCHPTAAIKDAEAARSCISSAVSRPHLGKRGSHPTLWAHISSIVEDDLLRQALLGYGPQRLSPGREISLVPFLDRVSQRIRYLSSWTTLVRLCLFLEVQHRRCSTADHPTSTVADAPRLIHTLCTAPSAVQRATIETYFTPNASFTHPFCRTGSFPGSIWLIIMIYRWYKILSPHIEVGVDSVGASHLSRSCTIELVLMAKRSFRQREDASLCLSPPELQALDCPLL